MDFEGGNAATEEISDDRLETQSTSSSVLNNTFESYCSFESENDEGRLENLNLKPTFKSVQQAKKRLQAFSSTDKLKDLYAKEEKPEDKNAHKEKTKKTKNKAKYDDYARSVIEEIEFEKRIGAVPAINPLPSPIFESAETLALLAKSKAVLEMYQVKKWSPTHQEKPPEPPRSPTPDRKDQFKKREIKINKNNLRSSSISFTVERSPSPDHKIDKIVKPQVVYPKSWAEYKELKLDNDKHARIKAKLPRNHDPFQLSHYYNFETPSRPLETYRCRSQNNYDISVPFFHLRCTGTQPKIHYCVNWVRNQQTYISKQELYRIIPKERMEIIEKIPARRKKFIETPLTLRQWYPKNWKRNDLFDSNLLEKSVGLSFLQTYSDDEENDEVIEEETEENDHKPLEESKKKPEDKKKGKSIVNEEEKRKQREEFDKTMKEIQELEKQLQESKQEHSQDRESQGESKKSKKKNLPKADEEKLCQSDEEPKKKKKKKKKTKKKKVEEEDSQSSEECKSKKRRRKQSKKKDKKKHKKSKRKRKSSSSSSSSEKEKKISKKKKKKLKIDEHSEEPEKEATELPIEPEKPTEIPEEKPKKKMKKNRWGDAEEVKRDNICDEDYMLKEYEYQAALEEEQLKNVKARTPEKDTRCDKKKKQEESVETEQQTDEECPKKRDKKRECNEEKILDLRQHIEEKAKSRKEKEAIERRDLREELEKKRHDKDKKLQHEEGNKYLEKSPVKHEVTIPRYNLEEDVKKSANRYEGKAKIHLEEEFMYKEIKRHHEKPLDNKEGPPKKDSNFTKRCHDRELAKYEDIRSRLYLEEEKINRDLDAIKKHHEKFLAKHDDNKVKMYPEEEIVYKRDMDSKKFDMSSTKQEDMNSKSYIIEDEDRHKKDSDKPKETKLEKRPHKEEFVRSRSVSKESKKKEEKPEKHKKEEGINEEISHKTPKKSSEEETHGEKRKRPPEKEHAPIVKVKEEPDWENIKSKRRKHLQEDKKEVATEDVELFPLEKEITMIKEEPEPPRRNQVVLPKPKSLDTSWESDEETFPPLERKYSHHLDDRRPSLSTTLDLEIPLNIKPFKRRETEILDPDRELQILKKRSRTLNEERRKLEIEKMRVKELEMELIREVGNDYNRSKYKFDWDTEIESIKKSARWDQKVVDKIDLTSVKTEENDIIVNTCNTSVALENEYEEFLKAVTSSSEKQKKPKPKEQTITISSDSDSFEIIKEEMTPKHNKSPLQIVTNIDELLPKSIANIPLPNEDDVPPNIPEIKNDTPLEAKTEEVLPETKEEIKPVPVPSPKVIDIKNPTLNFSLSTNITQNITVNLSSSIAKISSNVESTPSKIDTPIVDSKTTSSPQLADMTIDSVVEDGADVQKLGEPKPFVFHLPKKQLIDNSNLNLDDSDTDDQAKIDEKKRKKLEALIQENMEEMKVLEVVKVPAKKEEQVSKGTEEKINPVVKQEPKRPHSPKSSNRVKQVSPRRKIRSPSPRKTSSSRRRSSPRRRHRSPSPRRRSPPRRIRRSKSPRRRRSVSPRRKSPVRKRSPSPPRRKENRSKSPKRTNIPDSTISDDLLQQSVPTQDDYKPRSFEKFQETSQYDSPKRVPLDVRINQVLGIEPISSPKPSYQQQYQSPVSYAEQKGVYTPAASVFNIPMPSTSKVVMSTPKMKPLPQNIVQVGNIMEIKPTVDFSRGEVSPQPQQQQQLQLQQLQQMQVPMEPIIRMTPKDAGPPSFKQVGNVLQILPTEHFPDREVLPTPSPKTEVDFFPAEVKIEQPDVQMQEIQSAEEAMKQKVAERRAEREKRRLEREQRRREKERRRKEREKQRQQRLKIRTENLIKKALEMEENEGIPGLDESMNEAPAQWPPVNFVVVHNATKEVGKSILIKGGTKKEELEVGVEKKQKTVQFADGIKPGEGTSPSAGEELSSPPPQRKKLPKEKRYQKAKYEKKKVKVKIIRKKVKDESDEEDNLPPPSPPPGSPPPHLWPPRIKPQPQPVQAQIQPAYIANIPSISQYQALYRPPIGIIMAPPPPPPPGAPPHLQLPSPHPHHHHHHHHGGGGALAPAHFAGMLHHHHHHQGYQGAAAAAAAPMVPGVAHHAHALHQPPPPQQAQMAGLMGHLGGPPPPPPPLPGPSGLGHHGHPSHSSYGRHHY